VNDAYKGDAKSAREIHRAGIEEVAEATPVTTARAYVSDVVREESTSDRAWLARVLGDTDIHRSTVTSSGRHFTGTDQRRSIQQALSNAEVARHLDGRFSVLGCDLVWRRPAALQARHSTRVFIFNYTRNILLEVAVEDGRVVSVAECKPHEYPESSMEMAQAISLARAHDSLRSHVGELSAHAILRIPRDRERPGFGHRCMWVMFTETNDSARELPVLYQALVDLVDLHVIAAGPAAADVSTE
jgi:hypothetical protein